jgi:hypothetical protein
MARGKKMIEAQRHKAAEKLAAGVARREVAETLGVTKRSIERLCADPDFRAEVESARHRRELANHHAAKKMAQRHHVPEPLHPDDVREERTALDVEMERAREAVLARQAARLPTPSETVLQWVLAQPVADQSDFLDRNDARLGVVSRRALARFKGEQSGRTPQVQVWWVPSIAEQSGWRFS